MRPIPLTPRVLEFAYSRGYFPMSDETGEVQWYRPDPRAVLPLEGFHCSRSLARILRRGDFEVRLDTSFSQVMRLCADRPEGSWISEEFLDAYTMMHRQGKAHSLEIWVKETLVGGVYGLSLGGAFFAESMFHRKTDASKIALFHLVQRLNQCGYSLLEVQFLTPHLASLGAIEIPDAEYEKQLRTALLLQPKALVSEK